METWNEIFEGSRFRAMRFWTIKIIFLSRERGHLQPMVLFLSQVLYKVVVCLNFDVLETLIDAVDVGEHALPVRRVAHLDHVVDVQQRDDAGFFPVER